MGTVQRRIAIQPRKSAISQTIRIHVRTEEQESPAEGSHSSEEIRFTTRKPQKSCYFVCAVTAKQRRVERIRPYRSLDLTARDTSSYTIWEAAHATSAAPLYFPAITIQGAEYYDGGLDSDNPVIEVVEETHQQFPEAAIDTAVNIETGERRIPDPVGGLTNVINHSICHSTDTEGNHARVMTERAFEDVRSRYFRF